VVLAAQEGLAEIRPLGSLDRFERRIGSIDRQTDEEKEAIRSRTAPDFGGFYRDSGLRFPLESGLSAGHSPRAETRGSLEGGDRNLLMVLKPINFLKAQGGDVGGEDKGPDPGPGSICPYGPACGRRRSASPEFRVLDKSRGLGGKHSTPFAKEGRTTVPRETSRSLRV